MDTLKDKSRAKQKMMNLFRPKHAHSKSIASKTSLNDDDLTILDPPILNKVPYYAHSIVSVATNNNNLSYPCQGDLQTTTTKNEPATQEFGHLAQQHALEFTMRATGAAHNATPTPSPTESEFSEKSLALVSAGLQGEKERNMILEQQIRMVSEQAALALDRLSDVSKQNETLREENERLVKKAGRFSIVHRQSSVASKQSSVDSTFSRDRMTMSQASSMSSIQSHLHGRTSMCIDELTTSYEKELNVLRTQLMESKEDLLQANLELSTTQVELTTTKKQLRKLQDEIAINERSIVELNAQIESFKERLNAMTHENSKLWRKFTTKKKQTDAQIEDYRNQVKDLVNQLMHRQQQDLKLRDRLMLYDECNSVIRTSSSLLASTI